MSDPPNNKEEESEFLIPQTTHSDSPTFNGDEKINVPPLQPYLLFC